MTRPKYMEGVTGDSGIATAVPPPLSPGSNIPMCTFADALATRNMAEGAPIPSNCEVVTRAYIAITVCCRHCALNNFGIVGNHTAGTDIQKYLHSLTRVLKYLVYM